MTIEHSQLPPAPPMVEPFRPFTITVENPGEAAALAAALGPTSPAAAAAHFVKMGYKTRFAELTEAAVSTAARRSLLQLYEACLAAIA